MITDFFEQRFIGHTRRGCQVDGGLQACRNYKFPGWGNPVPVQDSAMELSEVTCPTCFEVFEVAVPHPDEMPTEVDYDCEVCCRPMMIVFTENEVYAKGLVD